MRSHLAGLGTALVARGHRVEVISPAALGTFHGLPLVSCGRARGLSFGGTRIDATWANWGEVRSVARRGYDVMHFHTIWNPAMPFQLATAFAGPKVATFHDVPGRNTPALARWAMTPASRIITRLWLREVIAVAPVVSEYLSQVPHVVIPNGIAPPNTLASTNLRRGIVYVGRLEPRKDVATLLDALAQLRDLDLPVHIAGDGELRATLEQRARSLGLNNVTFLGEVSESAKWELLSRSAVLVAPSNGGESFGIVLLEAMAAGAVPIASDIPGYRGVLGERATDVLFPAGDAAALAARLRDLTGDAARLASLTSWGSEYWKRFRWTDIAERVERVYGNALHAN
ncbi:MAG: glycosyltransferase family 4 protein [Gemmatimonadota bacterium]